jgi:hypothetical protein
MIFNGGLIDLANAAEVLCAAAVWGNPFGECALPLFFCIEQELPITSRYINEVVRTGICFIIKLFKAPYRHKGPTIDAIKLLLYLFA